MLFSFTFGQGIASGAGVDKGANDWAWRAKHGILRLLWCNGYMVAPDSPVAHALAGLVTNVQQSRPTPTCPTVTSHCQLHTATSSAPKIWHLVDTTTARITEAASTTSEVETAPAARSTATVTVVQPLLSQWLPEALRWPGANDFKGRRILLGIGGSIVFFGIVALFARLGKAPPYITESGVHLEAQAVDYSSSSSDDDSSSDDESSIALPTTTGNTRRKRQHHIRRIAATLALRARLRRLRRRKCKVASLTLVAQREELVSIAVDIRRPGEQVVNAVESPAEQRQKTRGGRAKEGSLTDGARIAGPGLFSDWLATFEASGDIGSSNTSQANKFESNTQHRAQSNVAPVATATISQPEVPVSIAGSVGSPLETMPAGEILRAGTGTLVELNPTTTSGSTNPSDTAQPHGNIGAHTHDGGLVVDIGTTKQALVATSLTVERYAGRVPAQDRFGADTNSTNPSTGTPATSASSSPSTGVLNSHTQPVDASGSNNSVSTALAPVAGNKELVSVARGIGQPEVPVTSAGAATQAPAIPETSKRAGGPTAIGATSPLAASHANGTKTLSALTPTLSEVRRATASEKGKAPDYTNSGTSSTSNYAVPGSHQINTGLRNMLDMLAYLNSNESEQILERAIDEIDAPRTMRTNSDDRGAGGIWIGNRSRADTVLLNPDTLSMDTMISEYLTLSRDERQRFLEAMVEWQEASPNERTAILATNDTGDTGTDTGTGVLAHYESTTSIDYMLSLLEYLPGVEYQQLIVDALNDIDVPRAKPPDIPSTLTRENFRVSDLLDWYHTLSHEERELFIGLAMG
ncbi:hypothetical protein GGI24_002341 [Coemansia furcata]|nr:hypothetical protein GGI24_002341 [Coemansia furcata]